MWNSMTELDSLSWRSWVPLGSQVSAKFGSKLWDVKSPPLLQSRSKQVAKQTKVFWSDWKSCWERNVKPQEQVWYKREWGTVPLKILKIAFWIYVTLTQAHFKSCSCPAHCFMCPNNSTHIWRILSEHMLFFYVVIWSRDCPCLWST